jgi:hypothetical protein
VETSNYCSELVGSRIAKGLILEVRYMLWSLGVALDLPELNVGDNRSVIFDTNVASSVLKKKQNSVAYQRLILAIITSN